MFNVLTLIEYEISGNMTLQVSSPTVLSTRFIIYVYVFLVLSTSVNKSVIT